MHQKHSFRKQEFTRIQGIQYSTTFHAKKAKEDESKLFWAEVKEEVNFMNRYSILDDSAREKAEKDRKIQKKKMRASLRAYKGPSLTSYSAKEAENDRQKKFRKDFNKIDGRWLKIKREANIIYLGWSNSKLEKMTEDANLVILDQEVAQLELQESINAKAETFKIFQAKRGTGSGKEGNGSDRSNSMSQ